MTTPVVTKPRGRPRKSPEIAVTPVRQVCQWCATQITAGQNPPIWGTCAKCAVKEAAWLAEEPCPNCGARSAISVAGVKVKGGHRDSCITRAEPVTPRRKLTEEDVAEIRSRLGPASKDL